MKKVKLLNKTKEKITNLEERLHSNKTYSLNDLHTIKQIFNNIIQNSYGITFNNNTMKFYEKLGFKIETYNEINYKISLGV